MSDNWRKRARCRPGNPEGIHPEEFYPDDNRGVEAARRLCDGCPTRTECMTEAAEIEGLRSSKLRFGIWGGLSHQERAATAGIVSKASQSSGQLSSPTGPIKVLIEAACADGLSPERLAGMTGVSKKTIVSIADGRQRTCHADTAKKIRAVVEGLLRKAS